jgi:hypothetical protein
MKETANFKKDCNLDYYDWIFWNVYIESIEHFVCAVHKPHCGAAVSYYDALGSRLSEKRQRFNGNIPDLIEVINIFGKRWKTVGEWTGPTF